MCSGVVIFAQRAPIVIAGGFPAASPSLQGVNYTALEHMVEGVQRKSGLTSLVILHDGYLVAEKYYRKSCGESRHDVCSVAKTVTGLLVGIAIKKGYLKDVNDPVAEYLPVLSEDRDKRKRQIAIHHLLSMTSGLAWENDDYKKLMKAEDPLRFVLSRPLLSVPSEKFNYDVSAYVLSALLSRVSGMRADSFAQKNLFDPLGIEGVAWDTIGAYTTGYTGLRMTSRDMAKIGQFMLQSGFTGTDSLLPNNWIPEMAVNRAKNGIGASAEGIGAAEDGGYGYACWVARRGTVRFFWAGGYGGQRIIIVPDKKLVVVMTASLLRPLWMPPRRYQKKMMDQDRNLLDFFTTQLLPCFR